MRRRFALQFLRGELVWVYGDRLLLYRPDPKETPDATTPPFRESSGSERGYILRDNPLRVIREYGEAEVYPDAEAILDAGWNVDR